MARINRRTARAVKNMERSIAQWAGFSPMQALESVGGNFKPETVELISKGGVEFSEHRGIINPLTNKALGIGSDGWTPVHNKVVADSIQRCAEAMGQKPQVISAYSQDGGKLVGIDATIGDGEAIIGDDKVIPVISCFNGNAGNRPTKFQFFLARGICSNGMVMVVPGCDSVVSCKHTKKTGDRYEFTFANVIKAFGDAQMDMITAFKMMAERKVSKSEVESYFREVAKIRGDKKEKADQTVKDLWEVYYNGRNHKDGTPDNVWFAFNAATEYLQHWGFRDEMSMLVSNLDGAASQMKAKAYEAALALSA